VIHFTNRKSLTKSTLLFQRLFKETPRIQKFFAKFASVAADALPGNADYEKQVALVADRVDTIISALDDKLQLLGNINYMRYTHTARSIPRGAWDVS
jgi:hypothetical protein